MFKTEFDPDLIAAASWMEIHKLDPKEHLITISGLLPTPEENTEDIIKAV